MQVDPLIVDSPMENLSNLLLNLKYNTKRKIAAGLFQFTRLSSLFSIFSPSGAETK